MNFTIITQGCKVNQYDSDIISAAMIKEGFTAAEEKQNPDIIIVNTCTVTASSDKKGFHILSKIKRDCPNSITVLTGCYPQAFPDNLPDDADLAVGNGDKEQIPQLIKQYIDTNRCCSDIRKLGKAYEEPKELSHCNKTRAYIKIEEGCSRFCSYCIIPFARGRVRSRTLKNIARETEFHANDGHKEIVLTGINLSCYGSDLGLSLYDAVKIVADNPLIERVRLSSLEPELLTEDVIEKLAQVKKLCPHFHLSLQSGCDNTLKRMNRNYSTAEYKDIVDNLRKYFPNCAITTDVMVGFVGETDEEFAKSLNFVQSLGFAKIHVFTYSVRPGTAAEKMSGHIDDKIKALRYKGMSRAAVEAQNEFYSRNLNVVHKVLVERQTKPEFINGHTENYIPVRIYGGKAKRHDIVAVKITKACEGYCEAVLL